MSAFAFRVLSFNIRGQVKKDGGPIAFVAGPVVVHTGGAAYFSELVRLGYVDVLLSGNALSAGDLNGDKRTDLILLADKHVYLLAQTEEGALAEPEKIPVSITARAAQIMDVNGDGRQDLLLVYIRRATLAGHLPAVHDRAAVDDRVIKVDQHGAGKRNGRGGSAVGVDHDVTLAQSYVLRCRLAAAARPAPA